jgi:hypothetical protein
MNKYKQLTGYGIVYRDVMISDRLSINAKALYGLMSSYAGDKKSCFPTQETMSNNLGCSIPTIKRALKELVDNCLIEKEKLYKDNRMKNQNKYYLTIPGWLIEGSWVNHRGVTGDTSQQVTDDTYKNNTLNNNNKTKSIESSIEHSNIENKKTKSKSVDIQEDLNIKRVKSKFKETEKIIYDEMKKRNASVIWHGGKYGIAIKRMLKSCDDDIDLIKQKIKLFNTKMSKDKFLQSHGLNPSTLLSQWNSLKIIVESTDIDLEQQARIDRIRSSQKEKAVSF